jgi:hypothetical protein
MFNRLRLHRAAASSKEEVGNSCFFLIQ